MADAKLPFGVSILKLFLTFDLRFAGSHILYNLIFYCTICQVEYFSVNEFFVLSRIASPAKVHVIANDGKQLISATLPLFEF